MAPRPMFDHRAQTDRLIRGAALLGVTLTAEQAGQLARYAELLEEWNERLNLTRVPPEDYVTLHFLDSLAVAHVFVDPKSKIQNPKCLDVGTGAGFPGIPIKIAFPELDATLLDSTSKKLAFLDAVIADLGLTGIRTLHARAEEAGRDPAHREHYHIVTARAVSPMNVLAEWMLPLVCVSGTAVAMKSAGADHEISAAEGAILKLGGRIERTEHAAIPGTDIERLLVVIRKEKRTPPQYPRPAGATKRKPL